MKKIVSYLFGICFSPQDTFKKIKKEEYRNNQVLVTIAIAMFLLQLLSGFIQPSQYTHFPAGNSWLWIFFTPVLVVLSGWGVVTGLLHIVLRLFSKSGTLYRLLLLKGLIAILYQLAGIILDYLVQYVAQFDILKQVVTLLALLWFLYLSTVGISILYQISKKKALLAQLLAFVVFVAVLIFIIVIFQAVFFFSHSYSTHLAPLPISTLK